MYACARLTSCMTWTLITDDQPTSPPSCLPCPLTPPPLPTPGPGLLGQCCSNGCVKKRKQTLVMAVGSTDAWKAFCNPRHMSPTRPNSPTAPPPHHSRFPPTPPNPKPPSPHAHTFTHHPTNLLHRAPPPKKIPHHHTPHHNPQAPASNLRAPAHPPAPPHLQPQTIFPRPHLCDLGHDVHKAKRVPERVRGAHAKRNAIPCQARATFFAHSEAPTQARATSS